MPPSLGRWTADEKQEQPNTRTLWWEREGHFLVVGDWDTNRVRWGTGACPVESVVHPRWTSQKAQPTETET